MTPFAPADHRSRLRQRVAAAARGAGSRVDAAREAATSTMRPRRGAKRQVTEVIRQLPHYGRLLAGLLTDSRVSGVNRALAAIALVYLVLPLDFIPDYIPFLGQVDDVYLVMLALQRLVDGAGRRVLAEHWTGERGELRRLDIAAAVGAAAFFLPSRMRRRLRGMLD